MISLFLYKSNSAGKFLITFRVYLFSFNYLNPGKIRSFQTSGIHRYFEDQGIQSSGNSDFVHAGMHFIFTDRPHLALTLLLIPGI